MQRPLARWLLVVYFSLVLGAFVLAGARLSQSTEMPGLAAVELLMLGLPWSLALSVEPFAHFGWLGMTAVVCASLGGNAFILSRLSTWLQRRDLRAGR